MSVSDEEFVLADREESQLDDRTDAHTVVKTMQHGAGMGSASVAGMSVSGSVAARRIDVNQVPFHLLGTLMVTTHTRIHT